MKSLNEIPAVKGQTRKLEWGDLVPGFDDTADGQKINSSSITMGVAAGTATVKHDGKSQKINIIQNFGASLTLTGPRRSFHLSLQKLVDYAVENGLLDDAIDFPACPNEEDSK